MAEKVVSSSPSSPDVHRPTSPSSSSSRRGANRTKTLKVIVVGDSAVGKTCLSFRFCSGHFPGETEATIGVDFREKLIRVQDEVARLQVWDTAGQERFRRSMVSHYYRNVSAAVLVYDVTRKDSFEALNTWIRECAEHGVNPDTVPMIVVGNKCEVKEELKVVSTSEAQRFADDFRMPLFETSAKDDAKCDHVEAIFMTLAHKAMRNASLKTATTSTESGVHPAVKRLQESLGGDNDNKRDTSSGCC